MELPACRTYHSVYPKYQQGPYAQQFILQANTENVHFVKNPQNQKTCLGTQVVCYDVKYGSAPPNSDSLRRQALTNQTLKRIMLSRQQNTPVAETGSTWWI